RFWDQPFSFLLSRVLFFGVFPFSISIILPTGEKVKLFFEIFSSILSSKGKGGLTPPFNCLLCEFFQPVDITVKPRHGNPSCVACSFRVRSEEHTSELQSRENL